jgi:DNA repair protein RadC
MKSLPLLKVAKEGRTPYLGHQITGPGDAVELIRKMIADADREYFVVVFLNRRHRPVGMEIVGIGSLDACIVHPREVFMAAILTNSAAILCAHNHPSGDPSPSAEDVEVTRRLGQAGDLLGIQLLDSLVIGEDSWFSMKEEGLA